MIKIPLTTLYLLIGLLGLFLRWYHPSFYPFGFDQVQIMQNAQAIKQGDLSLIGPMTGPAAMFTGPLIYYIAALGLFFINSPYVLVFSSLLIYAVTAGILFLLLNSYLKKENGLIFFTIWSVSPFIVMLDRITWNPNLTLIASFLVFIPLIKIFKERSVTKTDSIYLLLGLFLSYQAHFSGLILVFLAMLTLLFWAKNYLTLRLMPMLGFIFSLIPTLVFDLRNNYLNFKGLVAFITANHRDGGSSFILTLLRNIVVTFENMGRLLLEGNSLILLTLIGIVILGLSLYRFRIAEDKTILFSLIWIFGVTILVSMYKKPSPEYYFLVQFPAIIYLIAYLFSGLKIKSGYIWAALWIGLSLFHSLDKYKNSERLNIGNQLEMQRYISQYALEKPIKQIAYDMPYSANDGLLYLLNQQVLSAEGDTLHLVYPYKNNSFADFKSGSLALWIDSRKSGYNYIELPFLLIQSPSYIKLLQNYYISDLAKTEFSFEVYSNELHIGKLYLYNRKLHNIAFLEWRQQFDNYHKNKLANPQSDWQDISFKGLTWIYALDDQNILVYVPESNGIDLINPDFTQIKIIKSAL